MRSSIYFKTSIFGMPTLGSEQSLPSCMCVSESDFRNTKSTTNMIAAIAPSRT